MATIRLTKKQTILLVFNWYMESELELKNKDGKDLVDILSEELIKKYNISLDTDEKQSD